MTTYWVLAAFVGLILLLIRSSISPAKLFGSLALLFFFTGQISQTAFLDSYAHPALISVLVLILIGLVFERSALIARMTERILTGSPRVAVFKLSILTAFFSAFMSNTAVVSALLSPLSQQNRIAPRTILIVLSYASILGGVTTLIGTSTNLLVYSLAKSEGIDEIGLFSFTGIGVVLVLAGAFVLASSTDSNAKNVPISNDASDDKAHKFFLETKVNSDSSLVGKTVAENALRRLDGLFLLEIIRDNQLLSPVRPDEIVLADDRLIFIGATEKLQALERFDGLEVFGSTTSSLLKDNLIEVVISHQSELIDKTPREVDFRTLFDSAVVAIRRGNKRLTGQLGRIKLKVGDSLILAIGNDFKQHKNIDRNFHVLTESALPPPLTGKDTLIALGGLFAVVLCVGMSWLSLLQATLGLCLAFVATKLLSPSQIRRRFPFELWILIGSAIAISQVMTDSGVSDLIAQSISFLMSPFGIMGAFIGVYLITWLATELLTNAAAAALTFPIAVSQASQFEASPMPFVMAVAFAASASFILPTSYQTHMIVYSSGHYRFEDFAKKGLILSSVYASICLFLIPYFFPFM